MNTSSNPRVARLILLLLLSFVFLVVSCPDDGTELDCMNDPNREALWSPYDTPVWHPSGDFIGFNYKPRDSMVQASGPCDYREYFNWDSAGFWLVDTDGDNMRRVFPYMLYLPAWSPDGNWIAFSLGGFIYKMRFNGNGFDTTSITELTTSGRDHSPSWSPDGQQIAYYNTDCGSQSEPLPPNSCGIMTMSAEGSNKTLFRRGGFPSWSPDGQWVAYYARPFEIYKVRISNSLDTVRLTFRNPNSTDATWDSRYPKFSPNGRYVAFVSFRLGEPDDSDLWIVPANGGSIRKLTSHSTMPDPVSWSPNSRKIVYLRYRAYDFSRINGTLWTVDVVTGVEKQLTFNKH